MKIRKRNISLVRIELQLVVPGKRVKSSSGKGRFHPKILSGRSRNESMESNRLVYYKMKDEDEDEDEDKGEKRKTQIEWTTGRGMQ